MEGIRFSSQILTTDEQEALLDEAIENAKKWEGTLGVEAEESAADAFRFLKEGKIGLGSPGTDLSILRSLELRSHNGPIDPDFFIDINNKNGWNFAIVNIPLMLFPGRGAEYNLVEFYLNVISPQNFQRQPVIHSIFPESEWKSVIEFGSQLDLVLDSKLKWGVKVGDTTVEWSPIKNRLNGQIMNTNSISSFINVLPFRYDLGRADISAEWPSVTIMMRQSAPII
jgi:hypothetical protein